MILIYCFQEHTGKDPWAQSWTSHETKWRSSIFQTGSSDVIATLFPICWWELCITQRQPMKSVYWWTTGEPHQRGGDLKVFQRRTLANANQRYLLVLPHQLVLHSWQVFIFSLKLKVHKFSVQFVFWRIPCPEVLCVKTPKQSQTDLDSVFLDWFLHDMQTALIAFSY